MKINIKPYHFISILKKGYSLDMVYILELMYNRKDVSSLFQESKKVENIGNTLKRKGLITDDKIEITLKGKQLVEYLNTRAKVLKIKTIDDSNFDKWWNEYPGTNNFTYKGKSFTGERSLRVRKDECRAKFNGFINEGISADKLINALKFQVKQIKERSVQLKENKLTYLPNSLSYLNQRVFEPFMELIADNEVDDTQVGSVDI